MRPKIPTGVDPSMVSCFGIAKSGGVELWDVDETGRKLRLEFTGTPEGTVSLVVRQSPGLHADHNEDGTMASDGVFHMTAHQFGIAYMLSLHPDVLVELTREAALCKLDNISPDETVSRFLAKMTGAVKTSVDFLIGDAKSKAKVRA